MTTDTVVPEPARTALVVGATGISGRATCRRLVADGWSVLGLSRRSESDVEGVVPAHADLTDPASLRNVLDAVRGAGSVQHVARSPG